MSFRTIEEAIHYAISKENQSMNLYRMFQTIVTDTAAKKLLGDLANAEMEHKMMLERALNDGTVDRVGGKENGAIITMTQGTQEGTPKKDSTPQDIMKFALQNEKNAYDLYHGLMEHYRGTSIESLFARLAEEEMKHRHILEEQYENQFMEWM